ncbi:protein YpfM, partial [Enterobacter cloacae complex sp. 2024EL-00234]
MMIRFRRMRIIIREVVMIERELGNWKDFIEG